MDENTLGKAVCRGLVKSIEGENREEAFVRKLEWKYAVE